MGDHCSPKLNMTYCDIGLAKRKEKISFSKEQYGVHYIVVVVVPLRNDNGGHERPQKF